MLTNLYNKFERWMFRKHIAKIIIQTPKHAENLQKLYRDIRNAAREEFYEDPEAILDVFLREQFERTQLARPFEPEPRVIIKEISRRPTKTEINRVKNRKRKWCYRCNYR